MNLSLLVVLVVVGHSWVGWPNRTAERFVDEHYRTNIDVPNPFRFGTAEFSTFEKKRRPQLIHEERQRVSEVNLVPHKRTLIDVMAGRQTFDFGMDEFTICRGDVASGPTPFFDSAVRFYR